MAEISKRREKLETSSEPARPLGSPWEGPPAALPFLRRGCAEAGSARPARYHP